MGRKESNQTNKEYSITIYRMLVAIAELYFSPHYFDHSLIGAQSDQQVLKDMVKEKLPDLYNHLDSIDIELSTITLNWFLAVFFDAVPFQVHIMF